MVTLTKEEIKEFQRKVIGYSFDSAKSNYDSAMTRLMDAQTRYMARLKEKAQAEKQLQIVEKAGEFDVEGKINELAQIKKITEYGIDGSKIWFVTVPLTCRASNGGLYDVGAFRVEIDATNAQVRFSNTDEKYLRRSYWGRFCHHPHVSDEGEACLGNSAEPIAVLNSQFEYSAVAGICIAFLEQANLQDCAGLHVMNWDRIDKDRNVIWKGCVDAPRSEFEYDMEDCENDKPSTCHTCCYDGNRYEEGEMIYVEEYDTWIHKNNFDKQYFRCAVCNKVELVSYKKKTTLGNICRECFADKFEVCSVCGTWELKENFKENTNAFGTKKMCNKCFESLKKDEISGEFYLPKDLVKVKYTRKYVLLSLVADSADYTFDEVNNVIASKDAVTCENCGDYVHKKDVIDGLCVSCFNRKKELDELSEHVTEGATETASAIESAEPYFATAEEAEAYYNTQKGSN